MLGFGFVTLGSVQAYGEGADKPPKSRDLSVADKIKVEFLPEAGTFAGTMPYEEAFLVQAKFKKGTFKTFRLLWAERSVFEDNLEDACPESLGDDNGVLESLVESKRRADSSFPLLEQLVRSAKGAIPTSSCAEPWARRLEDDLDSLGTRKTGERRHLLGMIERLGKAESKQKDDDKRKAVARLGELLEAASRFGYVEALGAVEDTSHQLVIVPIEPLIYRREYRFCPYIERSLTPEEANRRAAKALRAVDEKLRRVFPLDGDKVCPTSTVDSPALAQDAQLGLADDVSDEVKKIIAGSRAAFSSLPSTFTTAQREKTKAYIASWLAVEEQRRRLCLAAADDLLGSGLVENLERMTPTKRTHTAGYSEQELFSFLRGAVESGKRGGLRSILLLMSKPKKDSSGLSWTPASSWASAKPRAEAEATLRVFADFAAITRSSAGAQPALTPLNNLIRQVRNDQETLVRKLEAMAGAGAGLAKELEKVAKVLSSGASLGTSIRPEPLSTNVETQGFFLTSDVGIAYFYFGGDAHGMVPTAGANIYFGIVDPSVPFIKNVYEDGYLTRMFSVVLGLSASAPGAAGQVKGIVGDGGVPYLGGAVQLLPFTRLSAGIAFARVNDQAPFEAEHELRIGGFVRGSVDIDVATLIQTGLKVFTGG